MIYTALDKVGLFCGDGVKITVNKNRVYTSGMVHIVKGDTVETDLDLQPEYFSKSTPKKEVTNAIGNI